MARRLTVFSKFLITLIILMGLVFGGRYFLTETEIGRNLLDQSGYTLPELNTDSLLEELKGERRDSESTTGVDTPKSAQSATGFFRTGTVYFEEGKDELSINGMALLDFHYSSMGKKTKAFKVLVEGHTDQGEAAGDRNEDLALNRARRVGEYLKAAHGLGSDQVAILSIGSEQPVGGCEGLSSEDCRALNRRAEVQLLNR